MDSFMESTVKAISVRKLNPIPLVNSVYLKFDLFYARTRRQELGLPFQG